jgi:hypothetical protein
MAEDFTALRTAVQKLKENPFRHGWQFEIEIGAIPLETLNTVYTNSTDDYTFPAVNGAPTSVDPPVDFDMYVKDITYDPITIEVEAEKIGGHTFNFPIAVSPTTITMTMRDDSERRIYEWFKKITDNIIDTDGTIKYLGEIEFLLKKYNLTADGKGGKKDGGTSFDSWYVIPTKLGEITESREETGNIEFPIVFVQSRTNYPSTNLMTYNK